MELTWELCDLNQGHLAWLDGRRGGANVKISRKAPRTAECTLSRHDDAALLATSADTILKVTAEGWSQPLFCGRIMVPDEESGETTEQLVLRAADPLEHLARIHYAAKLTYNSAGEWGAGSIFQWDPFSLLVYPFTVTYGPSWSATDESAILWSLIAHTTGHGIVQGTLANGVDRTLSFAPGKEIAAAIREITELDGGVDFEMTPTEETDGTLVEFNTYYPRQGSDKSASVIFKHGLGEDAGEDSTALDFKHAPEPPVNLALVIGGQSNYAAAHNTDLDPSAMLTIAVRAYHQDSLDEYGPFGTVEENGEITDPTYLAYKATGLISPDPVDFFDFTPTEASQSDEDLGLVFGPDGDFWMGDTIACEDHSREGDPITVEGRVDEATFTERESGEVDVDLTCAPHITSTGVATETLFLAPADGFP